MNAPDELRRAVERSILSIGGATLMSAANPAGQEAPEPLYREVIRQVLRPLLAEVPAQALGAVYQHLLRLEPRVTGGALTLEARGRSSVRRRIGSYYTPKALVDCLLDHSLEPTLDEAMGRADPERALLELRVCDPACGSGHFLGAAAERIARRLASLRGETASEALPDVIEHCIYGVDVDPIAVDLCRAALWQAAGRRGDPACFAADHLRCGDAILRGFAWRREFAHVFEQGDGFDLIVGNPPYLNVDRVWGRRDPRLLELAEEFPEIATDKTDLAFYFLARGLELSASRVAFLISRAFLEAAKARRLRNWIARTASVERLIDFGDQPVFPDVGVAVAIVVLHRERGKSPRVHRPRRTLAPTIEGHECPDISITDEQAFESYSVDPGQLEAPTWSFVAPRHEELIRSIDRAGPPLGDIMLVGKGMETGRNDAFTVDRARIHEWELPQRFWRRRARNSDILRYEIRDSGRVLLFTPAATCLDELPQSMREHLEQHRPALEARAAFRRGDCEWWQYTWPLHANRYGATRLLCPYLARDNRFAIDEQGECTLGLTDTTAIFVEGVPEDARYFAAILNSRVLTYRHRFLGKQKGSGIREYVENAVSRLPIPRLDLECPTKRELQDRIVELVRAREQATNPEDALALEAELEVLVARDAFALSREQHETILDTLSELKEQETRLYGAYRTRDLALALHNPAM